MATYEQNKKSIQNHQSKLDRLNVWIPKEGGLKQEIQAHAASKGESLQQFVLRAIRETMQRDRSPNIMLDGETPPAIQKYLDEVFEQRKAIVDATSYCGSTTKNPVWKDRTESKEGGEENNNE